MPEPRTQLSRLRIFALFFLGLFAALLAGQALRYLIIPPEVCYVPKETTLLVATGDVESLWNGVSAHFADLISAEGVPRGKIAQGLISLRDQMKNAPKPVTRSRTSKSTGLTREGGHCWLW